MMNRKQSINPALLPEGLLDYAEEPSTENADIDWVNKNWVRNALRVFALISLLSVCANTPVTFKKEPKLLYITFATDAFITILYTAEMIAKMRGKGLLRPKNPEKNPNDNKDKYPAYLKDKWCRFDAIMLAFHYISLGLHLFQILRPDTYALYAYLSIWRAPRPLIMIRFIRVFLKVKLPEKRLSAIFKRSGQQIYNVTLFFLFFMSLYALIGVQFFGPLEHHCIKINTNAANVTFNDLAIPDAICSPHKDGYNCPNGTSCQELQLPRDVRGFAGFDEFATSFFTVYQASSMEGWSLTMYRTMDALPTWRSVIYFFSLIFFLSWLVKNVFIAVITETFAEFRVHFQEMWGNRPLLSDGMSQQIIMIDDATGKWKLVTVDENKPKGPAPEVCQRILRSNGFHLGMLFLVFTNAITSASVHFRHDEQDWKSYERIFYVVELIFTILFDAEVVFKMYCLGIRGYLKRSAHKFELFLAITTTIHAEPTLFYHSQLTYFQVLRCVRLIKASPMLEGFVHKIFGPGRKLGSLIVFTICLLVITSCISMQFFCFVPQFKRFETFPDAFMSMFQILTQEGWIDVMDETMQQTGQFSPLVAFYFILYHLFATLIILSLFVAVILDNLELEEDMKKIKQMRAREQSVGTKEKLPYRLRVFTKFPDRPQMVKLPRMPSEFPIPKIRESFMRQFVSQEIDEPLILNEISCTTPVKQAPKRPMLIDTISTKMDYKSQPTPAEVQASLQALIRDAYKRRNMMNDAELNAKGAGGLLARDRARSVRRVDNSAARPKAALEAIRENGEAGFTAARKGNQKGKEQDVDIKLLQQKKLQAEIRRNQQEEDLRENHPNFDTPLFFVGRESRFRKFCQTIVYARYEILRRDPVTGKEIKSSYKVLGLVSYLDWVMIIVTVLSCASIMFETPSYRVMDHPILQIAEYAFVVCMSTELILKVLADGFLFTPKALIRDAGGILDLFIYTTSLVFIAWMPQKVPEQSSIQFLMVLRCLRPLRIFILVPHMRKVVIELCRGFKEIFLVSSLLVILMFMFSSFGVQLYGGKMARCTDPDIKDRNKCVGVFWRKIYVSKMKIPSAPGNDHPRMLVPRVWANPRNFNFDGIGMAMLALFETLSFKGWLEIRDTIIMQCGLAHSIYVHVFVFLGAMIGLTLFVGVVIANYSENKGTALLTVDQRRWCDLKKRLKIAQPLHLPSRPGGNPFRAFVYDITQNIYFKRLTAFLVIATSALLCLSWDSLKPYTVSLTTISVVFNWLFVCEVVMKMIAFSPHGYWQSRRNRYELLVTALGVVWIVAHFIWMNDYTNTFGFCVTMLRFSTISGKHATLKMLMLTVGVSMVKSFFIILWMFLLILVYAFAGVVLFGSVKWGDNVGRHANFQHAPRAIGVLFRIVTGEDWNRIMHDCMVTPPFCTRQLPPLDSFWDTDCGNWTGALIYFCSFYVMITYIVLNLLVAIIIENFSLFYSNEEDALLSYADLRNFQFTWNVVDVNQKGFIPVKRVKFLILLLKGRLEKLLAEDMFLLKHMCHELERLHNGDDVTFHDVLNTYSNRTVEIHKSLQFEELLARQELEYQIEEEVAKQTIRSWLDSCIRKIRLKQKGQQSLIHSLRAQNEALVPSAGTPATPGEDGKPEQRKRKAGVTERSGSVTGLTGRRFLQPSRSDAQAEPQVPETSREMRREGTKKRSGRSNPPKGLAEVAESNEKDVSMMPPRQNTLPMDGSIGEEKLPSEEEEARKALAESVKAIHEWYQREMEIMLSESDSDYDDSNYGY
ncbi:Sodium leak channel non-selective protein [Hypsibius exemplaris]|uniref:Sodium leak channel non-selective protein n=1 Tax=Hypsibius exemplaris TaxID=2072580 RepID=A0A1W0XEA0_HYPEX|nr:Sodium leak channel non-selective protein [Hypsibius exemplaris]